MRSDTQSSKLGNGASTLAANVLASVISALLVACTAATMIAAPNANPTSASAAPAKPIALSSAPAAVPLVKQPTLPAQTPALPVPPSTSGPLASAASAPVAAASSPAANPNLRPFNDLVKDFKKTEGFFTVWQKDDRYFVELKESDFDRQFYFALHRTQGLGERRLFAGEMLGAGIGSFHRAPGDRVQWLERNTTFFADGNKPMERGLSQAFPVSILSVAPIVSQAHPTSKAVLIDISAFILSDLPAGGSSLEAAYRLGYGFDRANSQILTARGNAVETSFEVLLHYGLARLPLQQPNQPAFSIPRNVPDARSVQMRFHYSFSALPEVMTPRMADPRVGYFFETRWDYRDDNLPSPRTHYIKRWRLEKQEVAASSSAPISESVSGPAAEGVVNTGELVEPKKPITFWIDNNVPERYRNAVREGILMWNSAFEKIGYKNAIVVKQKSDTDDFDTADRQHASVRWFVATDTVLAVGPSNADPRSGEILDADIIFADTWTRISRREITRDLFAANPSNANSSTNSSTNPSLVPHTHADHGDLCDFGEQAAMHMQDALSALVARGDIAPDSPEAEAFVNDTVRITIAHEVGHTLGLSHNFIATKAYTPAQLRDPEFIAKNGTSASVMDYVPPNINLSSEKSSGYHQKVLGPYDIWAIEYGYKAFPADAEKAGLKEIAERGQINPVLAYGNDIDAAGEGQGAGMDPDTNRFDLGSDTRAWFLRRVQFAQEQWDALAKRPPSDDPYYSQARLSVDRSISLLVNGAQTLAKKIGGIRIIRQTSPSARSSFVPVPEAEQREALTALTQTLFSSESFRIDPALLQRLPLDHLDRFDGTVSGGAAVEPNLPLVSRVLSAQVNILDQLTSDRTTTRLLESEMLRTRASGSLPLSELLGSLQNAIWQELDAKTTKPGTQDINLMRRNLQRAWLSRMSSIIITVRATAPDVRSLVRKDAMALRIKLQNALRLGKTYTAETRAHLEDSLAALDEALNAKMIRAPN